MSTTMEAKATIPANHIGKKCVLIVRKSRTPGIIQELTPGMMSDAVTVEKSGLYFCSKNFPRMPMPIEEALSIGEFEFDNDATEKDIA